MRRNARRLRSSRTQCSSNASSTRFSRLATPIRSAEVAERRCWIASPPHAADRRHARVVPASHVALLDQTQQLALAHQGVRHVETRELVLVGKRARQIERLEQPIVERPVGHELERADAVRHALDVVREPVREVSTWIDAPAVARVVMCDMTDAVEHGIAQPHVGRGHVDPGPKRPRPLRELPAVIRRKSSRLSASARPRYWLSWPARPARRACGRPPRVCDRRRTPCPSRSAARHRHAARRSSPMPGMPRALPADCAAVTAGR